MSFTCLPTFSLFRIRHILYKTESKQSPQIHVFFPSSMFYLSVPILTWFGQADKPYFKCCNVYLIKVFIKSG